jgi:signal transduction histidine kinase
VIGGNGAYISALLLFAHAIWAFRFSRPFPRWLYLWIPLVLLSFWLVFDESFMERSAAFSAWGAIGSAGCCVLLMWKVERQNRLANGVTALPFVLVGLASLVRLASNVGPDDNTETFYNQTGANALYMLGSILVSTVTLFGYSMMTGLRNQRIMNHKDEVIEARNRRLIESSRAKDLFFSVLAHDLRGPIGGAARYVRKHLMGKMSGLEARHSEVETLASSLEKTYDFLEKLLWWGRSQLEDWSPVRVPVDLSQTFERAVGLVRPSAELKEIRLEVAPGPYPQPIADPESVQLIVGNLLANAIKFTLPGRTVRLSTTEESGLCRIEVVDEGVGMDAQTLERLFRIEDKLSTHGTSGERGSGMGLLLSQSLAERNGGGITLQSEPGKGTQATVWLPTQNL